MWRIIITFTIVFAMCFIPNFMQELISVKQSSFYNVKANTQKKKATPKTGNGAKKKQYICKNYCGNSSSAKYSFHPFCSQKCKDAHKNKNKGNKKKK